MYKKNLSIIAVLVLLMTGCGTSSVENEKSNPESISSASQYNTLSEMEKENGWELLFDGKSTKG